jgi:hypothetical protein
MEPDMQWRRLSTLTKVAYSLKSKFYIFNPISFEEMIIREIYFTKLLAVKKILIENNLPRRDRTLLQCLSEYSETLFGKFQTEIDAVDLKPKPRRNFEIIDIASESIEDVDVRETFVIEKLITEKNTANVNISYKF